MSFESVALGHNPVLLYPCDDSGSAADDVSTTNLDGTWQQGTGGGYLFQQASLLPNGEGSCIDLDGTLQGLKIAGNAVHDTDITAEFSMAFWINPDAVASSERFVIGKWGGGTHGYWVTQIAGGQLRARIYDGTTSTEYAATNTVMAAGVTKWVVFTYHAANDRIRFYLDHILTDETTTFTRNLSAFTPNPAKALNFGRRNYEGTESGELTWNGRAQFITMFDFELTQVQIDAMWDAAQAEPGPPLEYAWFF